MQKHAEIMHEFELHSSHLERKNNMVELILLILFPNSHAHENNAFVKKAKITAHLSFLGTQIKIL